MAPPEAQVAHRLSPDERLTVLANERRRHVIEALGASSVPLAVADVAREVARRESDRDDPPAELTECVYLSLVHCHLPKLADARVVDRDRDRNVIAPGDSFGQVSTLLEALVR
ncbi:MAG: hypothetical protein ABEJ28_00565 [Salinigranum sp.]